MGMSIPGQAGTAVWNQVRLLLVMLQHILTPLWMHCTKWLGGTMMQHHACLHSLDISRYVLAELTIVLRRTDMLALEETFVTPSKRCRPSTSCTGDTVLRYVKKVCEIPVYKSTIEHSVYASLCPSQPRSGCMCRKCLVNSLYILDVHQDFAVFAWQVYCMTNLDKNIICLLQVTGHKKLGSKLRCYLGQRCYQCCTPWQ